MFATLVPKIYLQILNNWNSKKGNMCTPHNSRKFLISWELEPNQTEFQIIWSLSFPHDFYKKVENYEKK